MGSACNQCHYNIDDVSDGSAIEESYAMNYRKLNSSALQVYKKKMNAVKAKLDDDMSQLSSHKERIFNISDLKAAFSKLKRNKHDGSL